MGQAATRSRDGLAARRLAVSVVADVLTGRRALDLSLDPADGSEFRGLDARDRAMAKRLATETIRRHGQISDALGWLMERPLPRRAGRAVHILATGACEILFLDTPPHAAVDTAVRLCADDRDGRHFKGVVNAVLRRLSERRDAILADQDEAALNTPDWLAERWRTAYGSATADGIMRAHLAPPPIDLTVRGDAAGWAERLSGRVLVTGGLRLAAAGDPATLPGYGEGAWWVQDAAASLPARLLGDVAGLRVADLCAAPGGKTAQLCVAGAHVSAVDRSAARLARLRENLDRLALTADVVEADAATWTPSGPFDAVLLDAPCSATGTLRRHPDIARTRRPSEIESLVPLQRRLLDNALNLVRPGGLLVYAVCSLEPEEGEGQVERLLATAPVERVALAPGELSLPAAWVTPSGDVRTLPCHDPGAPGGMDGFYAARLRRY